MTISPLSQKSIDEHRANRGKIAVHSKVPLSSKEDLALWYSPGVAAVSSAIAQNSDEAYNLTGKSNAVAIVSDGSAVLGLGNIGPSAALPVMEGKAILMKEFADIDAYPLVLNTQNEDEIVAIVKAIAPGFGAINLEDISAPRCFHILEQLQDIGIPVFHDDQDGTAVVVRAALENALQVVGKSWDSITIALSGAGAAGTAISRLLPATAKIIVCDSHGIISPSRHDLNDEKKSFLSWTNQEGVSGTLADAVAGADVFIGVSGPNILSLEMVASMAERPIVFALANPNPEFDPELLSQSSIAVFATGRSDMPNQVNNVLVFPGMFRALLDNRYTKMEPWMLESCAHALAQLIEHPTETNIIPDVFDTRVVSAIVAALARK